MSGRHNKPKPPGQLDVLWFGQAEFSCTREHALHPVSMEGLDNPSSTSWTRIGFLGSDTVELVSSSGRSVVASAPALGAGDRRFESSRPDRYQVTKVLYFNCISWSGMGCFLAVVTLVHQFEPLRALFCSTDMG